MSLSFSSDHGGPYDDNFFNLFIHAEPSIFPINV